MKAVVVGGGIIGLCSAYYLQQSGWEVTVLDRDDLSDNCSFGNAGMIVPSHFTPLASPGIIAQGIRWMFDSKSPFYVRPALSLPLAKWGLQFIRHANQKNVEQGAPYLRDLSLLSYHLYQELANQPGFQFAFEQKGILMYFKTARTEDEESHLAVKARSLGLDAELISPDQIKVLEPGLQMDILGAVHYRCDAHLYPPALMQQLMKTFIKKGGRIRTHCPITHIQTQNSQIKKLSTDKEDFHADLFVLSAGAWMSTLAKMAGISIPLMPGKGYSITEKNPAFKLNIPAILCEARVAITPMNGYMRYGGTMEIASVNNRIHRKRVEGIIESIPKYFPNLSLKMPDTKDIWFGFRPCSPDGLPYIGFSRKLKNLIFAGGHSMMGLGLGPATGRVVSDLANGHPLPVGIDAFNPERFS
jgi:D-amino-acid dehydrogenase